MRTAKDHFIVCPKCGAQYLPGEIYLPERFVGKPENIKRNNNGEIVEYEGVEQDLYEEYVCDFCDSPLVIKCDLVYRSNINQKLDFNNDYVTELKTGLNLEEF